MLRSWAHSPHLGDVEQSARGTYGTLWRMRLSATIAAASALLVASMLSGCAAPTPDPSPTIDGDEAALVETTVENFIATQPVRAVIVKVTRDGETVYRDAFGESITGVPATPEMHFRNGAVAISYVAMVLLQLADEGVLSLDDRASEYVPGVPHADGVTLLQLAQMTSGIQDYVPSPVFLEAVYSDPYRSWSAEELIAIGADQPLWFEPGTNWGYSHTGYVILGKALEAATGTPLDQLIQERILDPLGLTGTRASLTAEIPEPALHAFTSERRPFFDITTDTVFTEESTYWNPSWTLPHGAVQTSTVDDLDTTIRAIGTGELLTPEAHEAMTSTALRGFGAPVNGCPSCFTQIEPYTYGIGLVTSGDWILQNPLFSGYAAVAAYLPDEELAISVAVTFLPEAFDSEGIYPNLADSLFRELGGVLAPTHAPPTRG